jgi:hypothetical protein
MEQNYLNVAESYALYDTIIVCKEMYGKEKTIPGWYTTFRDFANNHKHVFYKNRTIGNSHLAYCNMDSADNVDFVFNAISFGVRFFAPITHDALKEVLTPFGPELINENNPAFWLFELPKHCGIDFRVQQDAIVENCCMATPPGYGPRLGSGAQPIIYDPTDVNINASPFKITIGTMGEPSIENRFPFSLPLRIPRNATIEANVLLSGYIRSVMANMSGPEYWIGDGEYVAETPANTDFFKVPSRFGIQVSLYGYREVQQRGQYHAPGAIQRT